MSRIVIGIITYRRPNGLQRLLNSLVPELSSSDASIFVIDNDSARSAESVCLVYKDILDLTYDVEPRRGVSHPRNRVLDLGMGAKSIIFLDDDEWVEKGWYEQMLVASGNYPDALVTGPVQYILPAAKQSWADEAGYFRTHVHPHGSVLPSTGVGNTLIPATALRRLSSPRFDIAYSQSGGEDFELFSRLRKAGCEIRWVSGAVVNEEVPLSRATQQWVRQRFVRSGYIRAKVMLKNSKSHFVVAVHGVLRIGYGAGCSLLAALLAPKNRQARARAAATAQSGFGFLSAALNRSMREYGVESGER